METRIRYKRESETTLVSNKSFNVGGKEVRVHLNLGKSTFEVKTVNGGEVLAQGSDSSPAYVKKAAKNAMAKLGLSFGNESRKRTKPNESSPPGNSSSAA